MQATQDNNWLNSPINFLIFFVAFWSLISFLISFMSGWFTLSRRFRKQSEPYGDTKNAGPFFYTAYMRFWCHYSSVIRMTAASDALYLSVFFPFRLFQPPLCIPWKEIQFGRTKFLWRRYVVLTLGQRERIPLRISERMAAKLGILKRIPEAGNLPRERNFDTLTTVLSHRK
jgi:hypothetical protein